MKRVLPYLLAAILCLPAGTMCHELIGHGLVGLVMGGRVVRATVLGLDLWPRVRWSGWTGAYGQCDVRDIPTGTGELVMVLSGSMSTLLASIAAIALLIARKGRSRWARAALLSVGIWWTDLLTYTLPTWGIRRSIFWGGRYAEPYEAAVALGMNGRAFQIAVVMISIILAGLWVYTLRAPDKTVWHRRPAGASSGTEA